MFLRVFFRFLASFFSYKINRSIASPITKQNKILHSLLRSAQNTEFGKTHDFSSISSYEEFKKQVPVRDYEALKPYFDRIKEGHENVTWRGKPLYLAKTSGTTSGTKYIPISKESISNHINNARNTLMQFVHQTNKTELFQGKMIFIQGSPALETLNEIKVGRLSGIVAHHIPSYVKKNRLPSWETNCIEDWETKIEKIIEETQHENMTVIGGIPPWLLNYFETLLVKTGKKTVSEVFPNLQLLVTGGVNFEPYETSFKKIMGKPISVLQTYPASEGFIAYQNDYTDEGLLLAIDEGIFYEFIPLDEFHTENPTRLSLSEVVLHKDYAIILSTNAGLWAYSIGDTVRFTSLKPYKIVVSGRVKHFISAFGEHVISTEVEKALNKTIEKIPCEIIDFTVAPEVTPADGLPYHEWFIEFSQAPEDFLKFAAVLNEEMCLQNTYYDDLIKGKMLKTLQITQIKNNGFTQYMKQKGKLGGQNKLVRLMNNRDIADELQSFIKNDNE